jgi:hypothetical protein
MIILAIKNMGKFQTMQKFQFCLPKFQTICPDGSGILVVNRKTCKRLTLVPHRNIPTPYYQKAAHNTTKIYKETK